MEINYADIGKYQENKEAVTVCIIVSSSGNTPRHSGSKMIVFGDGTTLGTVGGGSIELEAIQVALETRKPHLRAFHLKDDAGMICGGEVIIYFEYLLPKQTLYIFGGGHVGQAIVETGINMNFDIVVIDNRSEIAARFKESYASVWQMDYEEAIKKIPYDLNSYFVITTPRHEYDETILAVIAGKPHKYIGMMASPQKVSAVRQKFLAENILSRELLDTIDMPIGVPIKCETPGDIAISIWARIVDIKNG